MHVLVGYASVHGSTAEVATRVAEVLRRAGLTATVADVADITDMQVFDACVLGSAIHSSALLPAMIAFFEQFRGPLAAMPVYLWLSCLRASEDGGDEHAIAHYVSGELLALVNGCVVFGGRLDVHELALNERWVLANLYDGNCKPDRIDADYRDWSAISDWAAEIGRELQSPLLHRSA